MVSPVLSSGTLPKGDQIGSAKASESTALVAILFVSAAAVAFLLWLLYWHHPPREFAARWMFLPRLNALLNGLSAVALMVGFYFIKRKRTHAHRACMLLAFGFSSLFLVSYITNHALHGDTRFPMGNPMRPVYLAILASHILLSIVVLPLVLMTLYLALGRRFALHRRVARVTFPIWLYVGITGVIVFEFLKAYAY